MEARLPLQQGPALPYPPPHLGGTQGNHLCILPDRESPGPLLDFLPRRVRNRSLTNLASSSSARFFFLSSSEMLISGSWSCTRSITCPAGSAVGGQMWGKSLGILAPQPTPQPRKLPRVDSASQTLARCWARETDRAASDR